jgi:LysM repeat protein
VFFFFKKNYLFKRYMKRTKIIFLLVAFLCVGSAAYSQNQYIIKKGETLWDVAKAMLIENGNARPTHLEILDAGDAIAKVNGCKDREECRMKFFSDKAIARGSVIRMPSNKKAPRKVEVNDFTADDPISSAISDFFFTWALASLGADEDKPDVNSKKSVTNVSAKSSISETKENRVEAAKPKQDAAAPKESPTIVTNKTMSFVQMVKRPFGVLPENSHGMLMDEVENGLSKYAGWKPTNSGFVYDMEVMSKNGYDMQFHGIVPKRAVCEFFKTGDRKELKGFGYIFSFEKKKEAAAFKDAVLTELKSVGSEFDNNYFGDVRAKYGSSYIVVSISVDKKSVTVLTQYMDNGSWVKQ